MCNSSENHFTWKLSGSLVFKPLVKRNEDPGYDGERLRAVLHCAESVVLYLNFFQVPSALSILQMLALKLPDEFN